MTWLWGERQGIRERGLQCDRRASLYAVQWCVCVCPFGELRRTLVVVLLSCNNYLLLVPLVSNIYTFTPLIGASLSTRYTTVLDHVTWVKPYVKTNLRSAALACLSQLSDQRKTTTTRMRMRQTGEETKLTNLSFLILPSVYVYGQTLQSLIQRDPNGNDRLPPITR